MTDTFDQLGLGVGQGLDETSQGKLGSFGKKADFAQTASVNCTFTGGRTGSPRRIRCNRSNWLIA